MAKPNYINDLEDRQRELREQLDTHIINQASMMHKIDQIQSCLGGTDYDSNGGLVSAVNRLRQDVKKNTNWRLRITAAGTAVATAISFVLIRFNVIIDSLRDLIKK